MPFYSPDTSTAFQSPLLLPASCIVPSEGTRGTHPLIVFPGSLKNSHSFKPRRHPDPRESHTSRVY